MRPVFIGGCHRSGTTLLGALLGAHPSCLTTPESQFKTEVLEGIGLPKTDADLRNIVRRALKARSLSRWGINPGRIQQAEEYAGADYGMFLHRLVDEYGVQLGRSSYDLWIDHTPKNVRHLQTLFSLFPEGRAIHLVRDGRGVAASVMSLDWGPNTIISAAHWWIHHVAFGLAAEGCFGEERVLRVRYEDLVATPDSELERICKWLGISFDSGMSQGGGFKFAQGAFRYHALIHDAPDASRAVAWRQSLSEREIRTFESRASDFLPFLGYELLFQGAESATIDRIRVALLEPILIAVNAGRFRYWRRKKEKMLSRSAKNEVGDA
jgi:hypothetical protein